MRLLFAMLLAGAAFGQTAKSFDVASVKPSNCARGADFRLYPGGRLHITCLTINVILRRAYDLPGLSDLGRPRLAGYRRFRY